jgi:hypothetical protein
MWTMSRDPMDALAAGARHPWRRPRATFAGTCRPHHEGMALLAALALVAAGLLLGVLMAQDLASLHAHASGYQGLLGAAAR